jgi:hypothetical protein
MNQRQYYNIRAVEVLEHALKIVISLKATPHNNHLIVVLLDELENDLKELRALKRKPGYNLLLDETSIQKKLATMFVLLIRFIISFFNIPLSCMQYLEIQILYI